MAGEQPNNSNKMHCQRRSREDGERGEMGWTLRLVSALEANSQRTVVEKDSWGRTTATIPRKQRRRDENISSISPTFVSVTVTHTHTRIIVVTINLLTHQSIHYDYDSDNKY